MQFQTNPRMELHVVVAQKQWDESFAHGGDASDDSTLASVDSMQRDL